MKKEQSILKRIVREGRSAALPGAAKFSIVLACILFDCVCFYTTYNLLLRQSQLLNIAVVGISAMTMDLFPVVLAMILSRSNKNRMEIGMAGSIAAAFACEALMSLYIRVNTRSMLFESGGLGLSLSQAASRNVSQEVSSAASNAQLGVVIMLGIIPILTSLLSFAVTYENPVRKRAEQREMQLLDLKEEINNHRVNIDLMEKELKTRDLYKLDKARFAVADILVDLAEVGSEIKVGHVIASVLSDVDATNILTEDSQIQGKINHARMRLNKLIEETDRNEEEEIQENADNNTEYQGKSKNPEKNKYREESEYQEENKNQEENEYQEENKNQEENRHQEDDEEENDHEKNE